MLWGKILSITDGNGNDVSANKNHIANINPLRYRGYYYDVETGLYYLQSRYYDPVTGRFINADGQLNTDSLLGFNMFAYCGNNPVNKIDFIGNKPGDLFNSPDEAAIDFAEYYNAKSIADKQEYGSAIYAITYTEMRQEVRRLKIDLKLFVISIPYLVETKIIVTKYYYTKAAVGKGGAGVLPNFFGFGRLVSTIHTHANYDPKYDNENFSTGFASDIGWSNFFHMDSYVVTPGGYLKKYTYANRKDANGGVSIISSDIPWDPNSPDHK